MPYYTSIAELTSKGVEDDFYAVHLYAQAFYDGIANGMARVTHSTSVVSEVRYVKKGIKRQYTFTYQYLGALIDDKSGLLSLVSDDL